MIFRKITPKNTNTIVYKKSHNSLTFHHFYGAQMSIIDKEEDDVKCFGTG